MLGSNYGVGIFWGLALIFDFFLNTFHFIQKIRTKHLPLYSFAVSGVIGLVNHKCNDVVLGLNPRFGICV